MKLPPILAILWARRAVFAIPVLGAVVGSSIAMAITPPLYQSSARVVLNYIKPDYVHVMEGGRIIKTGDKSLALELESRGYDWVAAESKSKAAA